MRNAAIRRPTTLAHVPKHRPDRVQSGQQARHVLPKYADKKIGNVVVERLVDGTGFAKKNLVDTLGISVDAMYRTDWVNSPTTQMRLRETLEILGRITDSTGGEVQAMAWYRGRPIPAFGGRTAESLVKTNQAGPLRDYLDQMAMGGFA